MKKSTRRKPYINESRWWDYLQVAAGALLMAFSFNGFLRPNELAPGGIAGFSIIIERITHVKPYWIIWGFNLVVLSASGFVLGPKVVKRSILGAFLVPLFIFGTETWVPALTDDLLMASIFGGVTTGLGIGIIFRGKGASGGFGSLVLLINHSTGIPIGRALLSLDACILLMGTFVFPLERVFGAMIAAFIISRTSQALLSGLDSSKVAFIITTKADEIQQAVLHQLDLGLTRMKAEGGYSGEDKVMLMVVARPGDMFRLQRLVGSYDKEAFLILSNASEVLGHGFKQHLIR